MEVPELNLKYLICVVRRDSTVTMIFVNKTNKSYNIQRGYIVGHVTVLRPKEILKIQIKQDVEEKIGVPERFKHSIQRLVREHNILFPKTATDTVKMKIITR